MDALKGLLVLAVFIGLWWAVARFGKKRGAHWALRHVAGAFVAVIGTGIVGAVLGPPPGNETSSAAAKEPARTTAAEPTRPLLDGDVPAELRQSFADGQILAVKKGTLTVRLQRLNEIKPDFPIAILVESMCASLWEAAGEGKPQPWSGIDRMRVTNASGTQGLEIALGDRECPELGKANDGGAFIRERTKPFGELTEADKAASCRGDLACWAEKHLVAATVACDDEIERLGQYTSRWTDGLLDQKFSRYRWADKERGLVGYIGDKIEFQNGFGAFQPHVYECVFDTATGAVVDARAQPGRL